MIPLATVTKTLKATPATQRSLRLVARFSGRDYSHLCRQNSKSTQPQQRMLPTGGAKRFVSMEVFAGIICVLGGFVMRPSFLFIPGMGLLGYAAYEYDINKERELAVLKAMSQKLEAITKKLELITQKGLESPFIHAPKVEALAQKETAKRTEKPSTYDPNAEAVTK